MFKYIEHQMKVRPDLRETPFQTGFHFFEDGSSQVIEGNDLKAPNERTPYLSPSGELQSSWEGPFLVMLTMETAVWTTERRQTHHTHVKKVPPPDQKE
jgi:hypothetical protein